MSVSVVITIRSKANKFDELRIKLLANLSVTRKFEGNELIRLVAPQEDPGVLLLIEEWVDLAAFKAYRAWRSETNSSALTPDLVLEPPEVVVADILF